MISNFPIIILLLDLSTWCATNHLWAVMYVYMGSYTKGKKDQKSKFLENLLIKTVKPTIKA